jgi:small subunit ribosomal protein S1
MAKDRVEDARTFISEGDEVEAKLTGMDRKNRSVFLSIKAKDIDEESEALRDYSASNEAGTTTSFGDLLKEQLKSDD